MQNTGQPYLAENLRMLCERKGSIAQVCRDLGINRQQFGKYLSGKLGASERTLTALAAYFGVPVTSLVYTELARDRNHEAENLPPAVVAAIREHYEAGGKVHLREGLYHLMYALRDFPEHFLRSLVVIRQRDGATYFRRWFTLAPYSKVRTNSLRTEGTVQQFGEDLSFLGRDAATAFPPSLMHMRAIDPHRHLFTGISLSYLPGKGSVATRTTMVRLPGNPGLMSAMRVCGIRKFSEEQLDGYVRRSLVDERSAIERFDPTSVYLADVLRGLSDSRSSR